MAGGQTEEKRMTQEEKIINYIKKAGYQIKTETIRVRNRDGSFSHVARYSWEVDS